jgi:heme exporter protein C
VVAFVQVPVVHLSVVWWRTLHQPPTILRPGDPTIDHRMLAALLVNLVAFTALFLILLRQRVELARVRDEAEAARRDPDRPVAGAAILPPRLEGAGGRG